MPQWLIVWILIKLLYLAPDKALFFNQTVLIFLLSLHQNICCGYSLEAFWQGNKKHIMWIPPLIWSYGTLSCLSIATDSAEQTPRSAFRPYTVCQPTSSSYTNQRVVKWRRSISKTCLYNFDPLKSHFYTAKLGFTGVYIIFLISAQNIDCGYSLEAPRRGGSNVYPQSMFWAEIWKISKSFYMKMLSFGW